jgi:hypothetical protein
MRGLPFFPLHRVAATSYLLNDNLVSISHVQAAPANGWAIGSAVKAMSPLDAIYYRRRYRRRRYRW